MLVVSIELLRYPAAVLVSLLVQVYAKNLGASILWQLLLAFPPAVITIIILAEVQRRIKFWKTKKDLTEEEVIYLELEKIAKEYYIWCRNEKVTKTPTLCVYLDCQYKKYSTDIPKGCSKCRLFQMTDCHRDWYAAKRTHDFASVNPKKEQGEKG
jgi:hypothetical protein